MTSRDLAALLRHARRESGHDRADAAERGGISDATLERWERGECLSQVVSLSKLLAFYGLELSVKRSRGPSSLPP